MMDSDLKDLQERSGRLQHLDQLTLVVIDLLDIVQDLRDEVHWLRAMKDG